MELDRTPGWMRPAFRSIDRGKKRKWLLWEEWEAIYADPHAQFRRLVKPPARSMRHRAAMDEGAAVLWPDGKDLYTLMCLRVEGGNQAFEQKQNSPVNPELCSGRRAILARGSWFDEWPRDLRVKVVAAGSEQRGAIRSTGDYSAFVRLGVDRQGVIYVQADMARKTDAADRGGWGGALPGSFGRMLSVWRRTRIGTCWARHWRRSSGGGGCWVCR